MQVEEILKAAAKGVAPDEELQCPERCLFYAMQDLYRRYRDGLIAKSDGEALKADILQQYKRDRSNYDLKNALIKNQATLWSKIELSASRYAKDPTIEHADAFMESVYGVRRLQTPEERKLLEN